MSTTRRLAAILGAHVRRRDLFALAGGAVALPFAANAQQRLPLVGFMDFDGVAKDEVQRGLAENGFVEGRDYRAQQTWGEFRPDWMGEQARALVRDGVSVIIANTQAALAAKTVTQTAPIVFSSQADPVEIGLVASLNRPGGNVTGIAMRITELAAKRLEVMRDVLPGARTFGYLRNARNAVVSKPEIEELQRAAKGFDIRLVIADAPTPAQYESALTMLANENAEALIGSGETVFWVNRHYLAAIVARRKIPAIYTARQFAEAGGLISFGARNRDGYQAMGSYAARILRGAKPSELPVLQVTKTELVVNLKAAKALDLPIPSVVLARADEVME